MPWLAPGITYRRHDDLIQDVAGNLLDVHKDSYAPGVTVGAQLDLGEAIYKKLVSKQLVQAAKHALEVQRQDTTLGAALGFFDLAFAQASVDVAQEAFRISADYGAQVQRAVEAGIAFKGDALRVKVQEERNQLSVRQALEQRRVAGVRLAQVLRLDPIVELVAPGGDLVALALSPTNAPLGTLVAEALVARAEIKRDRSLEEAAREAKKGTIYGPLIPTLGAQAFLGGLGGGRRGIADRFDNQEDYVVGLTWKIGPGGLFDATRQRATEARLQTARLNTEKIQDEITRQVVEAFTRVESLRDQINTAQRALQAAEESLRLARERKEFAVGVVLEVIQAEQDLTRARLDYLRVVAEFNRSQYVLSKALGRL